MEFVNSKCKLTPISTIFERAGIMQGALVSGNESYRVYFYAQICTVSALI